MGNSGLGEFEKSSKSSASTRMHLCNLQIGLNVGANGKECMHVWCWQICNFDSLSPTCATAEGMKTRMQTWKTFRFMKLVTDTRNLQFWIACTSVPLLSNQRLAWETRMQASNPVMPSNTCRPAQIYAHEPSVQDQRCYPFQPLCKHSCETHRALPWHQHGDKHKCMKPALPCYVHCSHVLSFRGVLHIIHEYTTLLMGYSFYELHQLQPAGCCDTCTCCVYLLINQLHKQFSIIPIRRCHSGSWKSAGPLYG